MSPTSSISRRVGPHIITPMDAWQHKEVLTLLTSVLSIQFFRESLVSENIVSLEEVLHHQGEAFINVLLTRNYIRWKAYSPMCSSSGTSTRPCYPSWSRKLKRPMVTHLIWGRSSWKWSASSFCLLSLKLTPLFLDSRCLNLAGTIHEDVHTVQYALLPLLPYVC